MRNVGSFGNILRHAVRRLDHERDADEAIKIWLLALCVSGQSTKLSAGWREFRIGRKSGERYFIPVQATTCQIRSGRYRRSLQRMLEDDLASEADFTFRTAGK